MALADPASLVQRGQAMRQRGDTSGANLAFGEALARDRGYWPALLERGMLRLDGGEIAAIPFRGNGFGDRPEGSLAECFQAAEPGFEAGPAGDMGVHAVAGVDAAQRRIGKVPCAAVEAEALIDEQGLVFAFAGPALEDRLAAVAVAGPLVEGEHAGKFG